MTYLLDTNSFRVLGNYYPQRFPSFWTQSDELVAAGKVFSVREVRRELDYQARRVHLRDWIGQNRDIFLLPGPEETRFVGTIFAVEHFQRLLAEKRRLSAGPVADPWLIAGAKIRGACVVTEELKKPNAAKIPNVCEHFDVDCTNLEGLMEREGWTF